MSVSLSAVPTEFLDVNEKTQKTGYKFSYFSSSAPAVAIPTSPTLQVTFELPVPEIFVIIFIIFYLQAKKKKKEKRKKKKKKEKRKRKKKKEKEKEKSLLPITSHHSF